MISSQQLGIIRSLDVHVRRELNPDMVNSTLFQQCSNTSSGVHGGMHESWRKNYVICILALHEMLQYQLSLKLH